MSPAKRISLIYLVIGILWIAISDPLLITLTGQNEQTVETLQAIKGWLFVLVTAVVLYWLLKREFDARQRTDQKAREEEAKFRALFHANPVPMWLYNRSTLEFVDVNEATCAKYGYSREEFLKLRITALRPPEDVPRLLETINQATPGQGYGGEWRHITKDGRLFDVATFAHILHFDGRETVLVVIQDISERKRVEAERLDNEKLRLQVAKEAELSTMRTRFTSMISHEFRRPLTTITTSIELLEHYRTRMTEEVIQKHFLRLHDQLNEMQELLDDFLILMRSEAGRRELKLVPVDLTALCSKLVEELRLSAGQRHSIIFESACTSVVIDGDEKLLRQAISNLLTNAAKYSPEGGEIRLELKQGQNLEIRVSDQGIGIPAEELPHIFDPFFRASNVGDLVGTGLGLPIARQAADAHGGTLEIARTDTTGTEFVLTLPLNERAFLTGC